MSDHSEAEATLEAFIAGLAQSLAPMPGGLVQFVGPSSDRAFEARLVSGSVRFTAKVSLPERGFWGLTREKAAELGSASAEHLILLTSESSGYFLSPAALTRLLPQFSVTRKDAAVRINENKVRAERRFSDLDELAELLQQRASARTA